MPESVTKELNDAKAAAVAAEAEAQELRARAASEESPLMVKFRLQFETLAGNFANLLTVLAEMQTLDAAAHEKCRGAVGNLIAQMSQRVG